MHKLNFCGTLCLPKATEGFPARGMDIIYSFEEAHIVPMSGAATPLHVLYASKPINRMCTPKPVNPRWQGKIEFLEPADFNGEDLVRVDNCIQVRASEIWIAPDHAVDPDMRVDLVFVNRNNSLLQIVENLFKEDHKKVVIWANNGIGKTVDMAGNEDGVLREYGLVNCKEWEGIAYAMRLGGKVYEQYQKGLKDTYQNSAHQHIHIAPTDSKNGFDMALISKLNEIHGNNKEIATLQDYRKMIELGVVDEEKQIPCIAVCVLESKNELPSELVFSFYKNEDLINPEQYKMAGLARKTITEYSKSKGLDFQDKEFKKEQIAKTKEFYERILN